MDPVDASQLSDSSSASLLVKLNEMMNAFFA